MLSNPAETKPSASAVFHEAAGSASTGINDADATRQSRKIEPLKAPGSALQSGRRMPTVSSSETATAVPMNGK